MKRVSTSKLNQSIKVAFRRFRTVTLSSSFIIVNCEESLFAQYQREATRSTFCVISAAGRPCNHITTSFKCYCQFHCLTLAALRAQQMPGLRGAPQRTAPVNLRHVVLPDGRLDLAYANIRPIHVYLENNHPRPQLSIVRQNLIPCTIAQGKHFTH